MLSTLTHEGDRQGEGSRRGGRKRILVGRDRKSLSKHRRGEGGRENRGRGRPSRRIGSRKRTFVSYCVRSIYTSREGWRGRGKTTPDDTALFARQNQRSWQRERVLVCRTMVLPMEIFFFGSSFPYHLPRLFQSPGPVLVCLRPREPKKELYFHPLLSISSSSHPRLTCTPSGFPYLLQGLFLSRPSLRKVERRSGG